MYHSYFGSFLDSMMSGGRGTQSNLDKLLESASNDPNGASLEAVLNDSEILTECKWANKRLLEL